MKHILIMISVLVFFAVPVFADTTAETIDPEREISLTVHLEEDEALSGIGITIYRVADVSVYRSAVSYETFGTAVYEPLIGGINYDGMTAAENEAAAALLTEEALDGLVSYKGVTDANGNVVFSDLEKGAYLVAETDSDDACTFNAFIAFAPQCGEDKSWTYQVICSPKTVQTNDQEIVQTQSAATGDSVNLPLFVFMLILSTGGAAAAAQTDKRRRKGEIQ